MSDDFVVNGLPLPPLLVSLLQEDKWKHPSDIKMLEIIPFLKDPIFFYSLEQIASSNTLTLSLSLPNQPDILFYEEPDTLFYKVRGSVSTTPVELPWLDVEKSIFIAVNLAQGDNIGIALDYRTSLGDPRVIASDWMPEVCFWREVTPTFTEFVERLGLK